jgi:predicted Rdx family selenoprotein
MPNLAPRIEIEYCTQYRWWLVTPKRREGNPVRRAGHSL